VETYGIHHATHADFEAHFREHGVPIPIPPHVRQLLAENGLPPVGVMRQQIAIVTPPHVGDGNPLDGQPHCGHCGRVVGEQDNLRLHAVAGAEGTDLRLLIRHCDACLDSDACSPERTTPGSGLPDGCPAGFCEAIH
jgi:hypothetical protein